MGDLYVNLLIGLVAGVFVAGGRRDLWNRFQSSAVGGRRAPPSPTAGQLIGTLDLRNRFSKAHPHPRKANHLGAFPGVVHALREG
jgi:hypothetical protein